MKKYNLGFTLIEMMVVISIIGILALVAIVNYKPAQQQFALERSAALLAQNLRKALEMAGQEWEPCKVGNPPEYRDDYKYSYGIHININEGDPDSNNKKYILFANCNSNASYEPTGGNPDKIIEEIELENKIIINDIPTSSKKIHIVFEPPDPTIIFKPGQVENNLSVSITLGIEDNPSLTKIVTVYKSGLIDY